MAYDQHALESARLAMLRARDELAAIRPRATDPIAHDLGVHVAWLLTALEQVWLPTVTRVLALDVLMPFAPRPADLRGLGTWENALPWVMGRQGWHVRPDSGRPPAHRPLTPAAARALGARLGHDDPHRWSAADWARLRPLLAEIAADPTLAEHFRVNLTNWAPLLNALGAAHVLAAADLDDVAALARSLGAIRRGAFGSTCPDVWSALPAVELLLPASRALLLPHLGLDPTVLAAEAAALLHDHPSTASILLPALTEMPLAITATMVLLVDDVPTLYRATPREIVDDALEAAIDPRHATPEQAERLITGVGEWLAAEGLHPETLGALLAPWLLAFSPVSRRFHGSPHELARLLAMAMSDPRSADRLATVAEHLDAHPLDGADLDEAAALVGLVRQLALDVAVRGAAHAEAAWDTLWAVASISAALAGFAPGSGVAVTGLSLVVAHWWAPDTGGVERSATAAMDRTLVAMAATALTDVVTRWRADGLVVPDPPDIDDASDDDDPASSVRFLREFGEWAARLPGGPDGPLATRAIRVVYSLVSPASAGEHLAEAI